VRRGKVRRAKLYYLRDRRGKSARIAERVDGVGAAKASAKDRAGPAGEFARKGLSPAVEAGET
jgi:large subunit ribosomal protein L19